MAYFFKNYCMSDKSCTNRISDNVNLTSIKTNQQTFWMINFSKVISFCTLFSTSGQQQPTPKLKEKPSDNYS